MALNNCAPMTKLLLAGRLATAEMNATRRTCEKSHVEAKLVWKSHCMTAANDHQRRTSHSSAEYELLRLECSVFFAPKGGRKWIPAMRAQIRAIGSEGECWEGWESEALPPATERTAAIWRPC